MGESECTYEPLDVIASDDPVTCADYARKNNLLDVFGWNRFKHLAKSENKLKRLINQSRLKPVQRGRIYKNGFEVPRNHNDVLRIVEENGNTKWQDAEKLELKSLFDNG